MAINDDDAPMIAGNLTEILARRDEMKAHTRAIDCIEDALESCHRMMEDLDVSRARAIVLARTVEEAAEQTTSLINAVKAAGARPTKKMKRLAKVSRGNLAELHGLLESQHASDAKMKHRIIKLVADASGVELHLPTGVEWAAEHRPVALCSTDTVLFVLTPDHDASPTAPVTYTSLLHSLKLTIVRHEEAAA